MSVLYTISANVVLMIEADSEEDARSQAEDLISDISLDYTLTEVWGE